MQEYSKVIKTVQIVFVAVVTLYFLKTVNNNYVADVNYVNAERHINDLNLGIALDYADNAIRLNPLEPNYYRMRARVYVNFLAREEAGNKPKLKQLIIRDLETAYNSNPQNLVTIRNIIPLFYFVAADNIMLPASEKNIDPDFYIFAKNFYAFSKNYSPNDVGIYALVAKYEKRLNMDAEYAYSVARVKELRPDLLDWYDSFR